MAVFVADARLALVVSRLRPVRPVVVGVALIVGVGPVVVGVATVVSWAGDEGWMWTSISGAGHAISTCGGRVWVRLYF